MWTNELFCSAFKSRDKNNQIVSDINIKVYIQIYTSVKLQGEWKWKLGVWLSDMFNNLLTFHFKHTETNQQGELTNTENKPRCWFQNCYHLEMNKTVKTSVALTTRSVTVTRRGVTVGRHWVRLRLSSDKSHSTTSSSVWVHTICPGQRSHGQVRSTVDK